MSNIISGVGVQFGMQVYVQELAYKMFFTKLTPIFFEFHVRGL